MNFVLFCKCTKDVAYFWSKIWFETDSCVRRASCMPSHSKERSQHRKGKRRLTTAGSRSWTAKWQALGNCSWGGRGVCSPALCSRFPTWKMLWIQEPGPTGMRKLQLRKLLSPSPKLIINATINSRLTPKASRIHCFKMTNFTEHIVKNIIHKMPKFISPTLVNNIACVGQI